MIRKAFLIRARKSMSDEYVTRHNPIWPELEKCLRDHGVSNYSIFLHEDSNMLFGYLEVKNESCLALLAQQEIMKRWWKYMTQVLESENENSEKAIEHSLKEVFHLS